MMGQWGDYGGWGMGFGFLVMILFWVLVVVGVVALIRWLLPSREARGPGAGEPRRDRTPLEILQERYARGEIGHEDYERMKRELRT